MLVRIITAIILIPLVLYALYASSTGIFALVTGGVFLFAGLEWTSLLGCKRLLKPLYLIAFCLVLLITFFLVSASLYGSASFIFFLLAACWWCLALCSIILYEAKLKSCVDSPVFNHIVLFCCLLPWWVGFYWLRQLGTIGQFLIVYLLVLIWFADSVAYFVGKRWGFKKLVPRVSPGKTWAGVYGALISALIIAMIGFPGLKKHLGILQDDWALLSAWILLSVVVVLFSIVGDLFISVLKRQRSLKDTGRLLPGHGGLLDRIDSLLSATPIFILGLIFLGLI